MLSWFKRLAVAGLCALAVNAAAVPLPPNPLENISPTSQSPASCGEALVFMMDFIKDGDEWRWLFYKGTGHFILVNFTQELVWKGIVVDGVAKAKDSISLNEAKKSDPCDFLLAPDA